MKREWWVFGRSGSARTAGIVGGVCLALLLMGCNPGSSIVTPGVPPALKHAWETAFNSGDAAAVAALYESDAQLLMSGVAAVSGADNIRHVVEGMVKEGLKVEIVTEDNIASGDLAYVSGKYRVLRGQGGASVEQGGFVEVWRRRNGVWAISLDVNAAGPAPHSD